MLKTVGIAAAGVAGGAVLTETFTSPASAATITETGAITPAVVALSDATVIAVDASLGNDFRVTIAGDRAMGNPANPADGQKIVFQVTQAAGGAFALSWGSSYLFSTGLPQPALSTAAGETDLLAFIYNAAMGKWLLVAYALGFSSASAPPPSGTFRFFSATNGPSAPASYTGPFLAGIMFEAVTGGIWLEGYWWWVCPSGQGTATQGFALWQVSGPRAGTVVATASVTSTALTPGQWNYISLPKPVALAPGATYVASTGFSNSFPISNDEFGSGQPYAAGISSGPIVAYSDLSGSRPDPFQMGQSLVSTAGTDPTANMPDNNYQSANFWMDVQVGTTPPTGATYRLWPSYPTLPGTASSETIGYTLATEFGLSQPCDLDRIWFYSATGAGALPARCAIWNVATQTVVAGTDNAAPSWSGGADSGWVSCAYGGVMLPAGDYKVTVFYAGGTQWYHATTSYWGGGGPGANGIVNGPLTAPGTSDASAPGQATYNPGSWAYPLTYNPSGNGENLWVDVEVTPS